MNELESLRNIQHDAHLSSGAIFDAILPQVLC